MIRYDYVLTNRAIVSDFKDIIKDDFQLINTKFVLEYYNNFNLLHVIDSTIDELGYIDGFDIAFDIIPLK